MEPGLIWLLAGVALLGAEMLLPGFYLLWVGLAAVGTGLVLLATSLGFGAAGAAFLTFLAAGIGMSVAARRRRGPAMRLNAPEAGLAGRMATVIAAEGSALRVRVGDSDWPARVPRGAAVPAIGASVRIEAVDGVVLVVVQG